MIRLMPHPHALSNILRINPSSIASLHYVAEAFLSPSRRLTPCSRVEVLDVSAGPSRSAKARMRYVNRPFMTASKRLAPFWCSCII